MEIKKIITFLLIFLLLQIGIIGIVGARLIKIRKSSKSFSQEEIKTPAMVRNKI